jgi:septum formation protein
MKIILASNSPRRKELLKAHNIEFDVIPSDISEVLNPNLSPVENVMELAKQKAEDVFNKTHKTAILAADTIVVYGNQILGKPVDEPEACSMLRKLSGRTHHVVTGVTLRTLECTHTFSCVTEVTFANLTDEQIDYYVSNFKPLDKAGAYGIQEWIGYVGVTGINGSFYNVMGLPVQRLNQELKNFIEQYTNPLLNSFIY